MTPTFATDDPVWYVAYASNLSADRLTCYLSGGRPEGGRRTYEGCRDPSPPTGDEALRLPGRLVFAGQSRVWGGAMAFYDTEADGEVVARGYRLTFGQLSDLVSQEARHPVGANLTPADVAGRPWPTPSGIYEALVHLGDRDGVPRFCLTSRRALVPGPPTAAYLRTILRGLGELLGWSADERATYLLRAAGVAPAWTHEDLTALALGLARL